MTDERKNNDFDKNISILVQVFISTVLVPGTSTVPGTTKRRQTTRIIRKQLRS